MGSGEGGSWVVLRRDLWSSGPDRLPLNSDLLYRRQTGEIETGRSRRIVLLNCLRACYSNEPVLDIMTLDKAIIMRK